MVACSNGHIHIARMLVGEYHAIIEIQTTVRAFAISRLWWCASMCLVTVRVVVVFGNVVDVADISGIYLVFLLSHLFVWLCFIILPLHLVVIDILFCLLERCLGCHVLVEYMIFIVHFPVCICILLFFCCGFVIYCLLPAADTLVRKFSVCMFIGFCV